MREIVPTKVIAASLGLAGFAIALVAGLSADNPASDIVLRAVVSMVACCLTGMAISAAAGRIVAEHLRKVGAPAAAAVPVPQSGGAAPQAPQSPGAPGGAP